MSQNTGREAVKEFLLHEERQVEENRLVEYKEVKGEKPLRSIVNACDEYAVAFLNSDGGTIYWGITDAERRVVGVPLDSGQRDRLQREVACKLAEIQPKVDPTRFRLVLHRVCGIEAPGNLYVVELSISSGEATTPYYTGGGQAFARVDGVKRKLQGPALTDWIKRRFVESDNDANQKLPEDLSELVHRVRHLFSVHGLSAAHLPRFVKTCRAPFSIALADLATDRALLNWSTDDKLQWLCDTFLIGRDWIDGERTEMHQLYSFDKQPAYFFSEITKHVDALIWGDCAASPDVFFIRWGIGKEWERRGESTVFVIIRVPIARMSDELIIYKYISDFEPYSWTYARTHIQLRAWARLLHVTMSMSCFGCEMSYAQGMVLWNQQRSLHELLEDRDVVRSSIAAVQDFLRAHGLPCEQTRLFPSE